jgi:hypothetical protein
MAREHENLVSKETRMKGNAALASFSGGRLQKALLQAL